MSTQIKNRTTEPVASQTRQQNGTVSPPADLSAAYQQTVQEVIAFMKAQIAEPISLQDMAEVAMLSPYHLSRVFRRVTGAPPHRFLAAIRLEKAKRLLLTTHLRVIDVCFEVGYTSLGTFSSRFTQLVGISPHGFRYLATQTAPFCLRSFVQQHEQNGYMQSAIKGTIYKPDALTTPIFVGLFNTSLPQDQPVACTVLSAPGFYQLPQVPDGRYYTFAASFPWSDDPHAYLLLNNQKESLQVGRNTYPLIIQNGQVEGNTDINLRAIRATDPPLVSNLFYLAYLSQNNQHPDQVAVTK